MENEKPKIFTLITVPIIGALGPDSQIVERDPCPACGMDHPAEIRFMDYQFDMWEHEELIKSSYETYAIMRRLWEAFQAAGLKGCTTRPMKVSRGRIMEDIDPEHEIVIPEFLELMIVGRADGPSGWWDRNGICPACRRLIWKPTQRITDAVFAKYSNETGPPRLVSIATWQGDDVFFLTDPGPPVVTERFKLFTEEQKCKASCCILPVGKLVFFGSL